MIRLSKTIFIFLYSFFKISLYIILFLLLTTFLIVPPIHASTYFYDNFSNAISGQTPILINPTAYTSSSGFFYDIPNFFYDSINGVWSNGNASAGDVLKASSINQNYYCAGLTLQRASNDNRTYPAISINETNKNDGYIFNTDLNWITGIIDQSSIYTPSEGYLYYSNTQHFNTSINQHWIQACNSAGTLTIYLDGNQLASVNDNNFEGGNVNFSLFYAPHSHITNWAITDSPTISSPTSSNDLGVPLLKQTDPFWGSQEYDSGDLWAPGHGTIANYGCAMTSAAMVFKYYNISKLPDNTDLDPGTLNAWLKSQPDGYVGEGMLNWLALTRLSKIAKLNNPSFTYDALQFSRGGSDKTQLTADINNNQPDILEEPGHFIVGKGIGDNTFDINDPYFNRNDLNNPAYNNSFLSLERFIPSYTNLSYLFFTVDPSADITLTNSEGQKVGSSFMQQGINDPLTNIVSPSLRELMVPIPSDGEYVVSINSNSKTSQNFTLNTYAYTASGSALMSTDTGTVKNNQPASFALSYQQDPSTTFINNYCLKGAKLTHDQRSFCHLLRKINR